MAKQQELVGDIFRVVIPGVPEKKARHKDYAIKGTNKRVHVNPNRKAQDRFAGIAIARKPDEPFTRALKVDVLAVFPYLKKHYKKNGELKDNIPVYKTTKPDKDNIEKFVFDSLNGLFWKDDAIIVDGRTTKIYGKEPRTEITIEVIE